MGRRFRFLFSAALAIVRARQHPTLFLLVYCCKVDDINIIHVEIIYLYSTSLPPSLEKVNMGERN